MMPDIRFAIKDCLTNSKTIAELENSLRKFSIVDTNSYWLSDFIQNPNLSEQFESDLHRIILISFTIDNSLPYKYRGKNRLRTSKDLVPDSHSGKQYDSNNEISITEEFRTLPPSWLNKILLRNNIRRVNIYNESDINYTKIFENLEENIINISFNTTYGNSIKRIPERISQFINLIEFSAQNVGLIEFPKYLLSLKFISSINLSFNKLKALPKIINPLGSKLILIDLSYNELQSIGWERVMCNNLDKLILTGNPIVKISLDLSKLTLRTHYQFSEEKGTYVNIKYNDHALILNECYGEIGENEIANFIESNKIHTLKIECAILANKLLRSSRISKIKCLKKLDLSWRPFRIYDQNLGIHVVVKNSAHDAARLFNIPESIQNFSYIEDLDLSGNRIDNIPDTIRALSRLRNLNLSSNTLRELPKDIGELKKLVYLDISSNHELLEIPGTIYNLNKLQKLNASFNHKLNVLDRDICKLKNLTYLNLECTSINKLPESIGDLKRLLYLNISNTEIDILPNSISQLQELIQFEMENTRLNSIDNIADGFENLKIINLGNNLNLFELPEFLFKSKNLLSLNCSKCNLKKISLKIDFLINLENLDLSLNKELDRIPESIIRLKKLTTLNLQGCQNIEYLPFTSNSLPSLEVINISETKISSLKEIFYLGSLKILKCFNTPIKVIDTSISNLENLESLDLRLTKIDEIPAEFGSLKLLNTFEGSEFKSPLPESFGNLVNLKFLSASFVNSLNSPLPASFERLQKLEICEISKPNMNQLPLHLGCLKGLKSLVIRRSALSALPNYLSNFKHLKVLDLWTNELTSNSINEMIDLNFTSLNNLYINDNPIVSASENMSLLKSLLPKAYISY